MNEPYKKREFLGFLSEYALCIPFVFPQKREKTIKKGPFLIFNF